MERPDIPNILNREFDVAAPDQVGCGDITYIRAQGSSHKPLRAPGRGMDVVEQTGYELGDQSAGHGL